MHALLVRQFFVFLQNQIRRNENKNHTTNKWNTTEIKTATPKNKKTYNRPQEENIELHLLQPRLVEELHFRIGAIDVLANAFLQLLALEILEPLRISVL